MESLGGVGYCENNFDGGIMNIARIFRDTNVNCIWEGTTSIMAEDLVRALKGKGGDEAIAALGRLVQRFMESCSANFPKEARDTDALWIAFKREVQSAAAVELLYTGRTLLRRLEIIFSSFLLMHDACTAQDRISVQIARRYVSSCMGNTSNVPSEGLQKAAALDREIFLGTEQSSLNLSPML
jgi:hypothetical protein